MADATPFVGSAPTILISGGVVIETARSGDRTIERAMSVRTLQRHGERIKRALARYAQGEDNILEE